MATCTAPAGTSSDPAFAQQGPAATGASGSRPEARPLRPDAASIDSTALLQGSKSVLISHNGEFYRLQSTRQGKLIIDQVKARLQADGGHAGATDLDIFHRLHAAHAHGAQTLAVLHDRHTALEQAVQAWRAEE